MRYKPFFIFTSILIILLTLESQAVVRQCGYMLKVKSNKENINPVNLPKGSIMAHGRMKTPSDYTYTPNDEGNARKQAARAIKKCLDSAIYSNGIPGKCKTRASLKNKDGAMKKYNIKNVKSVAFNTACSTARQLGKDGILEGITIYAYKNHGNHECQIKDEKNNNYYKLAKGLATECKDGVSIREIPVGKNKLTGWYIESATQINQRIKKWCMNTFRKSKYSIDHFEIKKDTGKVRAKYDCL